MYLATKLKARKSNLILIKGAKMSKKVALVTGANRGIGLETCRQLAVKQFRVILTARNQEVGLQAADQLSSEGYDVKFHSCDVMNDVSVEALKGFVVSKYKRLDVLVNNAGVLPDNKVEGVFEDTCLYADTSPEEAVKDIIWLSTLPSDGPTGKFFRNGQEIAW